MKFELCSEVITTPIYTSDWYWEDVLNNMTDEDRDLFNSLPENKRLKIINNYKEIAANIINSHTGAINDALSEEWNSEDFFGFDDKERKV